ncbi:hypothetical protein [Bradyrhizobium sp. NFR13]|uniref:hypothetical protein n=1 Tax=Bradyrhizobium sp. NFR13 TaxID=1566285 RepID=UPI000B847E69|nr:hypothetical protein [Bradyrhizobium sp. NFR13]
MTVQLENYDRVKLSCCTICPHVADCSNLGKCLTDIAREQLSKSHSPRVMIPTQATQVIGLLRAGNSLRKIHMANVVTVSKLANHIANYPLFGSEISRLAEANRKAADALKAPKGSKEKTHCLRGHPLSGDNLGFKRQGTGRYCKACNLARLKTAGTFHPAQIERVKLLLTNGVPLTHITGSRKKGGDFYTAPNNVVERYRRENPEFHAFVLEKVTGSKSRAQQRRWDRLRNVQRREEANDYTRISSLVPTYLPHRDDVINSIFLAICDGSLKREDVKARIGFFITQENKFAPSKFGVSLDAPAFRDGATPLVETISHGLWQDY